VVAGGIVVVANGALGVKPLGAGETGVAGTVLADDGSVEGIA
jgi:hypothetical protein